MVKTFTANSLSTMVRRIFLHQTVTWTYTAVLAVIIIVSLKIFYMGMATDKSEVSSTTGSSERKISEFKQLSKTEKSTASEIPTQLTLRPGVGADTKPRTSKKEDNQQKKLILIYTSLWHRKKWPGFETTHKFNNWGGHPCMIQNCEITYDRSEAPKANVIIFHGLAVDMVTQRELKFLSRFRNPNQVWIYFIHESPHGVNPSPTFFNGFFNWTMTYQTNADIIVPYNWEWGTWEKRSTPDESFNIDYAKGKDKLAYAIIGNCGLYEKFIRKFKSYVDVDVYGTCSKRIHGKVKGCQVGTRECEATKKRYKFYLAFENRFCRDYITEKFYKTIIDGYSVPIVLGGADYKKFAMPNSYIDALDFKTIKDLADHLKFLDRNDEAYNKFQKWRQDYMLGKPRSWSCEICRMINEKEISHKSYDNLGEWYGIQKNCGGIDDKFRSILQRSKA